MIVNLRRTAACLVLALASACADNGAPCDACLPDAAQAGAGGSSSFGFNISASPSSGTLTPGASTPPSTITMALVSGTAQPVSLSASGLPTGATVSFNPTNCSPTCTSQMTISTQASTPTGTFDVTVTGTADTVTKTASYSLTVNTPSTGGGVLKYLTAYGVDGWSSDLVAQLAHFDVVAVDNPDMNALPGTIRETYSHSQLKVLSYFDTCVDGQGTGHTDFDPSSSSYWGYYVEEAYLTWKSETGDAFDGVFLDNTYNDSCGDYPDCYNNNGGAPYATYLDYQVLGQWLTGQLGHARQIPIVLENGNSEAALYADLWMKEGFGSKSDIDSVASALHAGRGVVTLERGGYSGVPDTPAGCLYDLAAFLCAIESPGTAYFEFSDIWGPTEGYYPIMDTDCGSPLADYVATGDILTREFEHCTVTANVATQAGQIVMH